MPAVLLDRESTTWRHQKPVLLRCRVTVDYDMVLRQVMGEKIADLPSPPPHDFFRQTCIEGAKAWLHDMALQGSEYTLIGNETDIKVIAPLRSYKFDNVTHFRTDEFAFPDGRADILLFAFFKAKYARDVEVP